MSTRVSLLTVPVELDYTEKGLQRSRFRKPCKIPWRSPCRNMFARVSEVTFAVGYSVGRSKSNELPVILISAASTNS